MRFARTAAIAVALGTVVLGASTAGAANTQKGGTIYVSVTPNDRATYPIVIVGALADYGNATTIDKNGTVDEAGNYVRIVLKHGGFEVNSTTLNKKANSSVPTFNSTNNCSYSFMVTGPVTVFDGNGAYSGISGSLTITERFEAILPRLTSGKHKGQCNEANNAIPIASSGSISGSGSVSFS